MIWNFSNLYQPKKIGDKKFRFKTQKNKKNYYKFIELVILVSIILSFVTLIYSIGNIISIAYYSHSHGVVTSNVFLNISNVIFDNLSSILVMLTVIVFCKEKKGVFIAFLGLLVFFAVQSSFIKDNGSQITILYFFKITNLISFKNMGIISLNMGPIGGVILGLFFSYIINKIYDYRLPKILGLLNGLPITIICIILFAIIYAFAFLLVYILLYFLVIKLSDAIWSHTNTVNFFITFVGFILSPLGFESIIKDLFISQNYNHDEFLAIFKINCINHNFKYYELSGIWDNDIINNVWSKLQSMNINGKLTINQWILLFPYDKLPISNNSNTMVSLFDWWTTNSIDYNKNNYSIIFGFFVAFGVVLILSAKKENLKSMILIGSFMILTVILSGQTYVFSLMLLFISPILYFGLYLPITILNSILLNLLNVHLTALYNTGLIDYIIFGIIPAAKGTNFGWIFLFTGFWFVISAPILYFVILKKDIPFIGRTEVIIPRITHRQMHEIFNH